MYFAVTFCVPVYCDVRSAEIGRLSERTLKSAGSVAYLQ